MFKTRDEGLTSCFPGFGHLDFGNSDLPFDLAQGGESFDFAQDREPVERLVEPFRASNFGFRIFSATYELGLTVWKAINRVSAS